MQKKNSVWKSEDSMLVTAKDVMTAVYHTLDPNLPLREAVLQFEAAGKAEGRRIFGMMVVDEAGGLVGLLSMYDILLFLRPKHIGVWGAMENIDVDGLVEDAVGRAKSICVGDLMSSDLITVSPDTHLMAMVDLMIRKHVRRLPVLEDGKIIGIVYISDLFYDLARRLKT